MREGEADLLPDLALLLAASGPAERLKGRQRGGRMLRGPKGRLAAGVAYLTGLAFWWPTVEKCFSRGGGEGQGRPVVVLL